MNLIWLLFAAMFFLSLAGFIASWLPGLNQGVLGRFRWLAIPLAIGCVIGVVRVPFETVPGQILNLRDRPYHNGDQVIGTLKQGHKVYIRSVTYTSARSPYALIKDKKYRTLTAWASVDIDGINKHAGFVTMRYLTKNPLSPAYAKQL